MKNILILGLLLNTMLSWCQRNQFGAGATMSLPAYPPNSIMFDYDINGNQIKRRTIYLATGRKSGVSETKPEIKEDDKKYEESDIYSDVKYYPNPVVEILYVKWKNDESLNVANIELYNLNGQLMLTTSMNKNIEETEVNFQQYPSGFYELVLVYNDGNQKTLKIIKK